MKANELMIGDLVTFKDCQNEEEILVIKIWQLNQDGNALVFIDDSKVLDEIAIDDEIVGISLTPEILEKNGFNEVAKRKWVLSDEYTGDEVLVLYEVANAFAMTTEGMNIGFQSVHELQHAFRLCGINKEIEL